MRFVQIRLLAFTILAMAGFCLQTFAHPTPGFRGDSGGGCGSHSNESLRGEDS